MPQRAVLEGTRLKLDAAHSLAGPHLVRHLPSAAAGMNWLASVDNLPLGFHQRLLETLRGLVGHLKTRRVPAAAAEKEETA